MAKNIIGGVLEELETTAGNVVKQAGQAVKGIGSDAVGQVTGQVKGDNKNNNSPSDWEQIVGKPMDSTKYQQIKKSKEDEEQKNLAAIRRNLQQALEPLPEKQEPPKYIKAKIEKQEKMQELQEKQKGKPPPLQVKSAQGMAGAETRGGWGVGG